MERVIERVAFDTLSIARLKKVAAYTRVSSGKDAMLHSLAAQISYYNSFIQSNPEWSFAGIYTDEAISGTKVNREGFQRMIDDCRKGKIDMIVTKSISRFARNTLTLLQTVRELKELGVDVFFEEQNIHTMSGAGELLLTILASFAQEESLSVSQNQKWRVKQNFEKGLPWNCTMLGYRYKNGEFEIEPKEAETVRFIFTSFLDGMGLEAIAQTLNLQGAKTRYENPWGKSSVRCILQNLSYTGNLMLQTTYIENHITKKKVYNNGEKQQYYVENSHPAIVSQEEFDLVQAELIRRAGKHSPKGRKKNLYTFSGLLVCGNCGDTYRRKVTSKRVVYICNTYNTKGKNICASKAIPEETLKTLTLDILGIDFFDEEYIKAQIKQIKIENNYKVVFFLKNGDSVTKTWVPISRKDSWTPEMKERARQAELKRKGAHR